MNTSPTLDLKFVRSHFPALQKHDYIFMDNAGGSQILQPVMDRINSFMIDLNVQTGASYEFSAKATSAVRNSAATIGTMINANRPEEVVIGPSTTMLLRILSICMAQAMGTRG